MCIDIDLLDYYLRKANTNRKGLALELDWDRTTLSRRLTTGSFSMSDLYKTIAFLKLSAEDVRKIFFAESVAKTLPD